MVGDSNDETNFSHKLLLTYTQVSRIRTAFANGLSDNIKFSKTQPSKTIQLRRFLPWLKLMDSLLTSEMESVAKEASKKAFLNQKETLELFL